MLGDDKVRHHRIEYPDGTVYEGQLNHQKDIDALGLKRVDGLRVLDIATNDGFFAFWSEWSGASEVVAIDVGNYWDYDWGPNGPDEGVIKDLKQQDKWEDFDFHHRNLNSNVVKRQMSIYDIEELGPFDVIFNYGLIYHLRHPLKALDACRKVTRGFCIVETETPRHILPDIPTCVEGGVWSGIGAVTDTFFPTPACLASWMKKADFPWVFIQRRIYTNRVTVIGIVDPKYLEWFRHCKPCDHEYWRVIYKYSKAICRKEDAGYVEAVG